MAPPFRSNEKGSLLDTIALHQTETPTIKGCRVNNQSETTHCTAVACNSYETLEISKGKVCKALRAL